MKVFRDLYLHVQESIEEQFISEISNKLPQNWSRNIENEKRLNTASGIKYYCFICEKTDRLEQASVALTRKNSNIIYVPNIVPKEFGELSKDQYNSILLDFNDKVISPICKQLTVKVEITSDNQNIEDWVSEETSIKLKSFSGAANKSTGSSHPCDQERWFAFIVSIFRHNEKLDASQLANWLIKEEGWQYDIASELASEYEQGLLLLTYFNDN